MWGYFNDGVLKACDEVCGKRRGRRSKGDTWWWNEEVKDAVSRRKDAHKAMCWNNAEEYFVPFRQEENNTPRCKCFCIMFCFVSIGCLLLIGDWLPCVELVSLFVL